MLQTSRHVRIEVNGVEVANTRRAYFLLETGLRRRTYIPVMDTRLDLLTPSDTTSVCPYKVRVPDSVDMAYLTDAGLGVGELLRRTVAQWRGSQRYCVVLSRSQRRMYQDHGFVSLL